MPFTPEKMTDIIVHIGTRQKTVAV